MNSKDLKNELKIANKLYDNKEYIEAFNRYKKLAEEGIDKANYFLGNMYKNGEGVTKDINIALEYYKKVINKPPSLKDVIGVLLYENGNIIEAIKYIEDAVNEGDCNNAFPLATTYHYGDDGIDIDMDKALKYYTKACKCGYKQGCILMGKLVINQGGKVVDYIEENNLGILKCLYYMIFGKKWKF